MPLYVYSCSNCGEEFEKMVRLSEADRTPACPNCQSEETHKKITSFASYGGGSSGTYSSGGSSCGSSGRFS